MHFWEVGWAFNPLLLLKKNLKNGPCFGIETYEFSVKGTKKMHLTAFLTSKNQHFAIFTPTIYHLLNCLDILKNTGERLEHRMLLPPPFAYDGEK